MGCQVPVISTFRLSTPANVVTVEVTGMTYRYTFLKVEENGILFSSFSCIRNENQVQSHYVKVEKYGILFS